MTDSAGLSETAQDAAPAIEELAEGDLLLQRHPGIARITLNRPESLNAFTTAMYEALTEVLAELRADRATQVLIFRGEGGRAFSAGNDIAEFTSMTTGRDVAAYEAGVRALLRSVAELPQVSIAAIDGICVGGGLALATSCDVRVATVASKFGYPIARTLGNALSGAVVSSCASVFGDSLTREMLLTSSLITAERAHSVGAVARIVAAEELEPTVDSLARGIGRAAPLTLRATKTQLLRRADMHESSAGDDALLATVYGSSDFREGVDAFISRRRPLFTGQ